MILSLPDNRPDTLCICEYCRALVKVPVNIIGTGIAIKDFTILKESMFSNNETEIFIAHQISLDRPVVLELCKKDTFPNTSDFFQTSKFFASLNHKSISTIFNIGQEEGIIFRSYEYNDGNFISEVCQKKIPQKMAVNIFLDYIDVIIYFLRTQKEYYYGLLLDKAIITPEHQIKIIPSSLYLIPNPKCNAGIFKNITELFLDMITDSNVYNGDNFLPSLSDKLKEFVLANMNMPDNVFFNIINGKEKNYFLLYDKLKEEVLGV